MPPFSAVSITSLNKTESWASLDYTSRCDSMFPARCSSDRQNADKTKKTELTRPLWRRSRFLPIKFWGGKEKTKRRGKQGKTPPPSPRRAHITIIRTSPPCIMSDTWSSGSKEKPGSIRKYIPEGHFCHRIHVPAPIAPRLNNWSRIIYFLYIFIYISFLEKERKNIYTTKKGPFLCTSIPSLVGGPWGDCFSVFWPEELAASQSRATTKNRPGFGRGHIVRLGRFEGELLSPLFLFSFLFLSTFFFFLSKPSLVA